MSIHYAVNWNADTILVSGVRVSSNYEIKRLCHEFSLKYPWGSYSPTNVPLLAGKTFATKWLYGPACTLDTKSVIYPCNRYKCQLPCPCLICRKLRASPTCQVPQHQSCGCDECIEQFEDHSLYHRTFHFDCKFCANLVMTLPNFNFWFLNKNKRLMLDYFRSREHFEVKDLVVNIDRPRIKHGNSEKFYGRPERYEEMLKEKQELSKLKVCEECNYSFYNMQQWKEHIEINHQVSKRFFHNCQNNIEKDRLFRCDQCNVVLNSNKD